MKRVTSILFLTLATLFLIRCGLIASPEVAPRCHDTNGSGCVLYKVSGSSTRMEASFLDSNALRYAQIISAPWQITIGFEAHNTAYLTGQNLTGEGDVACEIWFNGHSTTAVKQEL